jgi:hypothetical protein
MVNPRPVNLQSKARQGKAELRLPIENPKIGPSRRRRRNPFMPAQAGIHDFVIPPALRGISTEDFIRRLRRFTQTTHQYTSA